MTGFAAMEPVKHATSTSFAAAVMKIQLKFGLCHTIILNKDSKFFGVFKEACDLLQLNRHVLYGGNHNPIMVERVNRYLVKGLKVMTNERGSVCIAMEAIHLLIYAWNRWGRGTRRIGVRVLRNLLCGRHLLCIANPVFLQTALDILVELFERLSLETNRLKMQAMICTSGRIRTQLSTASYHRMRLGFQTSKEWKARRVTCSHCNDSMQARSLPHHLATLHGVYQQTAPQQRTYSRSVAFTP